MSSVICTQACPSAGTVILHRGADHTVFCPAGTDGHVRMSAYPVFPGIEIIYNDVHTQSYTLPPASTAGLIEINHCHEGRIEYQYGSQFYFLAPGDMSVSLRDASQGAAQFPTGHYHGICVTIDPARAPECLSCFLQDVNVRPSAIAQKFCSDSSYFSARSSASVEHVFSELYHVPEQIRKGYFKVKVLELLLFLSALPVQPERQSYTKGQVKLAKVIADYLMNNAEGKLTVSDLSARFGASPSMIGSSFRGVYGMSPAAYLRAQKMHSAAVLLRTTDRTVLDIAGQFGYDNGSKFARAFRDVIGVSPAAYRAGADGDSCAPESVTPQSC